VTIAFTLRCQPPRHTAQQKGVRVVGKTPIFFTTPKMKALSEEWQWLMRPHAPRAPIEGPVSLSIAFVYPYPSNTRKGDRYGWTWKETSPDVDNVAKHFIDTMGKAGFFRDDGAVVDLWLRKLYGPHEHVGIYVRIHPAPSEGAAVTVFADELTRRD